MLKFFILNLFLISLVQAELKFTYQGEEVELEASPVSEYGISGDYKLVHYGVITFLIKNGTYELIDEVEKKGRLYLKNENGKFLVGLKLHYDYIEDDKVIINPFNGLKADDIKTVSGIHLDETLDQKTLKLLKLVHKNTFLEITDGAVTNLTLPELPNVRFLSISSRSSDSISDFNSISAMTELEYVNIYTLRDKVNASVLKTCKKNSGHS